MQIVLRGNYSKNLCPAIFLVTSSSMCLEGKRKERRESLPGRLTIELEAFVDLQAAVGQWPVEKQGYASVAKSCPDVEGMGDGDVEGQREQR